jgi:hypothetical protein
MAAGLVHPCCSQVGIKGVLAPLKVAGSLPVANSIPALLQFLNRPPSVSIPFPFFSSRKRQSSLSAWSTHSPIMGEILGEWKVTLSDD